MIDRRDAGTELTTGFRKVVSCLPTQAQGDEL
jgi:hypothetical protein